MRSGSFQSASQLPAPTGRGMGMRELKANFKGHSIIVQRRLRVFSGLKMEYKLYIDGYVDGSTEGYEKAIGANTVKRAKIAHKGKIHIVEVNHIVKAFSRNTLCICVDG